MEDGRGEFTRMNREEKMKDMRERLPFAGEENKDGGHERERDRFQEAAPAAL